MITSEIQQYAQGVWRNAITMKQRAGQYLFNHLPDGAAAVVRGTLFDPFYKDFSLHQLCEWIDEHLLIDNGQILAVFAFGGTLWEDSSTNSNDSKETNA